MGSGVIELGLQAVGGGPNDIVGIFSPQQGLDRRPFAVSDRGDQLSKRLALVVSVRLGQMRYSVAPPGLRARGDQVA